MYQNSQALPSHLQKMIFEMELRGYAPHTQSHYLGHLRLLEKHTNKSAPEITPDELKQYFHDRIKSGIGYSSITISCSAFQLFFFNETTILALRSNFLSLVDTMYNKNWVVFCKKPFKSPGHVVRYLGRYTHRVAISNSRILAFSR